MFICEYLAFRAGDSSSHKSSRVGSGNTDCSAPFVLMLRAGKHLPPRTPLKLDCVSPASVYSLGNSGRLIGSKQLHLIQCSVNGSDSVSEKAKHRKIFVSVPMWLSL